MGKAMSGVNKINERIKTKMAEGGSAEEMHAVLSKLLVHPAMRDVKNREALQGVSERMATSGVTELLAGSRGATEQKGASMLQTGESKESSAAKLLQDMTDRLRPVFAGTDGKMRADLMKLGDDLRGKMTYSKSFEEGMAGLEAAAVQALQGDLTDSTVDGLTEGVMDAMSSAATHREAQLLKALDEL